MAKALYGYLAGTDHQVRWENERLRARVAELQAEVERLTIELAAVGDATMVSVADELALDGEASLTLRPALA